METFEAIKTLIESLQQDVEKFETKGNAAAGTRIRKGMQELKNLAQEIRVQISEKKNSNK
jgi:hypothetical protein